MGFLYRGGVFYQRGGAAQWRHAAHNDAAFIHAPADRSADWALFMSDILCPLKEKPRWDDYIGARVWRAGEPSPLADSLESGRGAQFSTRRAVLISILCGGQVRLHIEADFVPKEIHRR